MAKGTGVSCCRAARVVKAAAPLVRVEISSQSGLPEVKGLEPKSIVTEKRPLLTDAARAVTELPI